MFTLCCCGVLRNVSQRTTPGNDATIGIVFRNRRFACLILGLWLGATVAVDLLLVQNFDSVDRFLPSPGSNAMAAKIKQAGKPSVRAILRRNASEENEWLSENWEEMQILISVIFFFLVLFGERPPKAALAMIPLMLALVVLQRFMLTPHIASLGREVDEIPGNALLHNPMVERYWNFRGFYLSCEAAKGLLGLGIALRLMVRRTFDKTSAKDQQLERILAREASQDNAFVERRRSSRRASDQGSRTNRER